MTAACQRPGVALRITCDGICGASVCFCVGVLPVLVLSSRFIFKVSECQRVEGRSSHGWDGLTSKVSCVYDDSSGVTASSLSVWLCVCVCVWKLLSSFVLDCVNSVSHEWITPIRLSVKIAAFSQIVATGDFLKKWEVEGFEIVDLRFILI